MSSILLGFFQDEKSKMARSRGVGRKRDRGYPKVPFEKSRQPEKKQKISEDLQPIPPYWESILALTQECFIQETTTINLIIPFLDVASLGKLKCVCLLFNKIIRVTICFGL
jgi:hypothetical protein